MGEFVRMIKITNPGLLTSIQDLGKYGFQKYGVIASGVMDRFANKSSSSYKPFPFLSMEHLFISETQA
jgi:hypothetical protein